MIIALISSSIALAGLVLFTGFQGADRYRSYVRDGREAELFMRPKPWERSAGLGIVYRHAYLQGVRKSAKRRAKLKSPNNVLGQSLDTWRELGDTEAVDAYLSAYEKHSRDFSKR